MFRGISRNPLTLRSISKWYLELKKEIISLRDVIDLEATYGSGPDGATVNNPLATAKVASTIQSNEMNEEEVLRKMKILILNLSIVKRKMIVTMECHQFLR